MTERIKKRSSFALDHRIPIAFVFTLLVQAAGAVWWASTTQAQDHFQDRRIADLETYTHANAALQSEIGERLARLETRAEEHSASLRRIENAVVKR